MWINREHWLSGVFLLVKSLEPRTGASPLPLCYPLSVSLRPSGRILAKGLENAGFPQVPSQPSQSTYRPHDFCFFSLSVHTSFAD